MTHNQPSFDRKTSTNSSSSEFRPARLQRRSYYIALTLAVMGLIVSLLNIFKAPQKQQKFSLKELSYSQVIKLFDNGAPEIIVSHAFGLDTLHKDSDYILLRDKVANRSASGATPVAAVNTEGTEDNWEEAQGSKEQIPTLRLDVNGARKAGSLLRFIIEDYDPKVFYYLDFGDGHRRKVSKNSVFTYSKPGTFVLHLYASIADKELYDSYSKIIRIDGSNAYTSATPKPTPNSNSIDDLFASKDEEDQLINKVDGKEKLGLTDPDFEEIIKDSSDLNSETVEISDLGVLQDPANKNNSEEPIITDSDKLPELVVETPLEEPQETRKAYYDAEMMPAFPGGIKAMGRYLKKNANYPERASRAGIEGTVNVRMVVRADGSISDLKVLSGLGYGCDDEALRLVSKMPRWIPGVQNGVSVPVYTVIPISFKLIQ